MRGAADRRVAGMARAVLLVCFACSVAGCHAGARDTKMKQPLNVLFIMSDQHSAHALGCYGNSEIKTPRLDKLARQGVRFENAFCQTAQCCPSRFTIWTGRYAHSHGLRWNHVIDPLEETTVGEVFRDAGYVTATIGKHHMQHDVALHGFDHLVHYSDYAKFIADAGVPHCWGEGEWIPDRKQRFSGEVGTAEVDNEHHIAGFWATKAIEFLQANKDKPFCLWLSFHGPHVPLSASREWMDMYDADKLTLPPNFRDRGDPEPKDIERLRSLFDGMSEADFKEILKVYYALVSQIDYNVGRVLDELDRLGLSDHTVVVYTTDHGEMMGEHGAFRKAILNYDATVHVPMIIRAPGMKANGSANEQLVGLIDLLPTLCDLAGVPCPEKVQGKSLVPLLQGDRVHWRNVIFSEIGYPRPDFPPGLSTMARTHDFKYIHHENAGEPIEELFDLRADPWETKNLAGDPAYADTLESLREAVKEWNATTDHAPLYPIEEEFKQNRRPE